jgi:hypothetical protein
MTIQAMGEDANFLCIKLDDGRRGWIETSTIEANPE